MINKFLFMVHGGFFMNLRFDALLEMRKLQTGLFLDGFSNCLHVLQMAEPKKNRTLKTNQRAVLVLMVEQEYQVYTTPAMNLSI